MTTPRLETAAHMPTLPMLFFALACFAFAFSLWYKYTMIWDRFGIDITLRWDRLHPICDNSPFVNVPMGSLWVPCSNTCIFNTFSNSGGWLEDAF